MPDTMQQTPTQQVEQLNQRTKRRAKRKPSPGVAVVPLMVDADNAAVICGFSRGTWWKLHASGRTPLAVRIGRKVLWRMADLKSWIEAGCPPRDASAAREHAQAKAAELGALANARR